MDALGKERSLAAVHRVCHSAVTDYNGRNEVIKVIKELLNNHNKHIFTYKTGLVVRVSDY